MLKLKEKQLLLKIRLLVLFFIGALVASGLTAFPLEAELKVINRVLETAPDSFLVLKNWMKIIYEGLQYTGENYPFLLYGTDWLAFAHLMIAVAFIGVYVQPVRNKWIIYWGMIMCICIIPTAFICGAIRQIPIYWQLIDCSFGVFGILPLMLVARWIRKLEQVINK